MPRRADGLVGRVLDRSELVEEEERVRDVGVHAARERSPHLEARALDMVLGVDHARDRAAHRGGRRGGEAGEYERVLYGHSRHARCNFVETATIPPAVVARRVWS
jgi:hypothetical protein